MRKLDLVPLAGDAAPANDGDGCMTRRAILATLAAAALTACSSTTVVIPSNDGAAPDDGGTDDGGTDDGGTAPPVVCKPSGTSAGALTSFPSGTWKAVGAFIIGHDAGGLFAFSTVCTHEGCTIGAPSSTGATQCPCHGARFDGNGAVVQGPARDPLPHFALTVCNGKVYVDTRTEVTAGTRTPAA